jgi:hypothetical protein
VNKLVVISEQELVRHARKMLESSSLASFRVVEYQGPELFDLAITLSFGGVESEFLADCQLRPTVKDVAYLAAQVLTRGKNPILVTVKLTTSLIEECKKQCVSCLDLNGYIWISAKGLAIERDVPPRNTRFVLEEPSANFFSHKSSRVARALLSFPDRAWKQADIAELTQLSKGLVSRLLNHATEQGWVDDKRGAWSLINRDSLLTAWEAADNFHKRVSVQQYSILEPNLRVIAQRLLQEFPGEIAFTQWFAASLRFPYTDCSILSLYRRQFPSDADLKRLGLREVSDGGKIWILTPKDTGVFQAVHKIADFPLVCDAQIYLDLIRAGFRGDDQAKALRGWEGFCKS